MTRFSETVFATFLGAFLGMLLFFLLLFVLPVAAGAGSASSRDFGSLENDYMDFNGANTPTALGKLYQGDFTVCAWVSPDSMGEGDLGSIYDSYIANSGGFSFLLRGIDDGAQRTLQLTVSCDVDTACTSRGENAGVDFALGEWSFLCAAFDRSTPTASSSDLYVNGSAITLGVQNTCDCTGTAVDDTDQAPRIGNVYNGTTRDFDGQIAFLAMYDSYLSAAEQLQLMRCPFSHHANRVGGPWPMMDGTGAIDYSGAGNDLTNNGAVSSSNGPPVIANCGSGGG